MVAVSSDLSITSFLPQIKLLVPTACGITSAVAMGAEFSGKSAVSNGIAVGKATAMAAAESEILLARSERVKVTVDESRSRSPSLVFSSSLSSFAALASPRVLARLSRRCLAAAAARAATAR
jgi:hypothetical protein